MNYVNCKYFYKSLPKFLAYFPRISTKFLAYFLRIFFSIFHRFTVRSNRVRVVLWSPMRPRPLPPPVPQVGNQNQNKIKSKNRTLFKHYMNIFSIPMYPELSRHDLSFNSISGPSSLVGSPQKSSPMKPQQQQSSQLWIESNKADRSRILIIIIWSFFSFAFYQQILCVLAFLTFDRSCWDNHFFFLLSMQFFCNL